MRSDRISRKGMILAGAVAIGLWMGLTVPVQAAFPEKPVKVIVPVKPGGTIDTVARIFQKTIDENKLLPVPMAVVNKPGAAGAVGTRTVKDSEPDGYTIVIFHSGVVTAAASGVTDFDHNHFEIIAKTGEMPMGLGTAKDSSLNTVADLISGAKEAPGGAFKYATNIGLPVHFLPLMVADQAGIKFGPVQAGGGVNRLNSVVGGHTKFGVFSVLDFLKYDAAGLQPVVLFAPERHAKLPNVPTAKESGYDVSWVEMRMWLAPKGTPKDRVDILAKALGDAMKAPELLKTFGELGMDATFGDGDSVKADLDDRLKRVKHIVDTVDVQFKKQK